MKPKSPPPSSSSSSFFFFFFFLISSSSSFSCIKFAGGAAVIAKSVVVDASGAGDFTTIAAAIAAVPSNNDRWIRIHVKPGIYREKLNVTNDKGFILLEGEGYEQTSVEWGDHAAFGINNYNGVMAASTADTPTVTLSGCNIVVKNIAFKNTYDGEARPAVAVLVEGDKISFHYCAFFGVQDTLCDLNGRHYYNNSYVQGAVDFIFGYGQSIFEGCTIASVGEKEMSYGFITAHGKATDSDPGGYVFKSCSVIGSLRTYLGRAWTPYARVVYYNTYMADIIIPQGWDPWTAKGGKEDLTFYAESDCTGPGSNTSGRVPWEKKVTKEQLKQFTDISFIDRDGWLGQQP